MARNNTSHRSGFGLVAGLAIGVLATIIFKKLAVGLLIGIIIAFLLSRMSK